MRRAIFCWAVISLFLPVVCLTAADPQPAVPSVMALVRQALDADLAGRGEERASLLRQALNQSPLYAPARWHSGEVLLAEQWLPVKQVQQQIASDRALKEYRQLRDQSDGSVAAHTALARWCRKQQWKDREEFHWRNVLRLQPKNREAIAALQLQQYFGMLMTADEIALYKDEVRRAEEALAHWQPILTDAQAAIDGGDSPERDKALACIRSIRDSTAISALASSLKEGSQAYVLAVITAMESIEGQAATDFLLWQALASKDEEICQAATDGLKARPWHSFVPQLLGALNSPLEMTRYGAGYQVFQDGPMSQVVMSSGRGTLQGVVAKQVSTTNSLNQRQNEQICRVLEQTTGQARLGPPQAWWKWWLDHNELCALDCKPIRRLRPPAAMSCFIPGTLVWTEAGLEPIERIRPGDRVLSQDPETGELGLRFVQETTLRPASPARRLRVGEETILCTLGHPFWSVNKGWRMAKELEPDERLYALNGTARLDELQDGPNWEAHNLAVEGFGTYFVGKSGLLVRDNNLGRVPLGPLPGYRLVQATTK